MSIKLTKDQKANGLPIWKQIGISLIVLGTVGACSSVPDYANPVEWYRGTVDAFSSDEAPADGQDQTADADSSVPGEDDDFPSLSSVPERPAVEDTDNVADGLIADPNAQNYASAITLQSSDDGVSLPATEDVTLQPAPPPQPTVAVEVDPMETSVTEMNEAAPDAPDMPTVADQESTQISVANTVSTSSGSIMSKPLVVEPGKLPSGETYEQYRARLMAGLERTGTPSPTTILTRQTGNQVFASSTVVISSNGVQNSGQFGGAVTMSSSQGMMTESGFLQIDQTNGQSLLAPGSVKIATIHFANGSSGLDLTDRRVLQKVAALQRQQGGIIRIIGHASSRTRAMDPVQHKMVNYNVSVARADRIARELVRLGATKSQIIIGAVSDTEPLYYEVMPSGEAGNRRAEIFIDS